MNGYRSDLAYIHDVGFGDFARKAAPGLLAILRRAGIRRGLVVDLGCGSGIWAAELTRGGYDVLGIDISRSMIELARKRAPAARFVNASFLSAKLPPCDAVTAIGECFTTAVPMWLPNSAARALPCACCGPMDACLCRQPAPRSWQQNADPRKLRRQWTSSTASTRSAKR